MSTKAKSKSEDKSEVPAEERLKAVFDLQQIHSKIDKIRTVRGELPLEVQDLEDEVVRLETRLNNLQEEIKTADTAITDKKNAMKDSAAAIKKYEAQQSKVRNNREYDSITKEIEFQNLEIQLCEKKIKEFKANILSKNELITQTETELKERKAVLKTKKAELDDIVAETEKEEQDLLKKAKAAEGKIEERLLTAYSRLRQNALNGLAVVMVDRDACGGCFNHIPPQRQLDIRTHKKIIVCEHCGRILVDPIITDNASAN